MKTLFEKGRVFSVCPSALQGEHRRATLEWLGALGLAIEWLGLSNQSCVGRESRINKSLEGPRTRKTPQL